MVYRVRGKVDFGPTTTETTLYVDIVAGNDGYDGTIGSPLKTVQEGVYRFIPLHEPAPLWDRGSDRLITVVYTAGMPVINEYLHIPLHRGEGVIRIVAEEHIEHTGLIQSGALSADGYYGDGYFYTHYELTTTTSPFTASTLGDGYFVRPDVNPNEHTLEFGYEVSPIVNNTANSLDVVLWSPGIWSGFGYVDTMSFDIVQPQITWSPPNDQAFITFTGGALITVDGGMFEVSGFEFESIGDGHALIQHSGSIQKAQDKLINLTSRCHIRQSSGDVWAPMFAGPGGFYIAGCLIELGNQGGTVMEGVTGGNIQNLRAYNGSNSSLSLYRNCSAVGLFGVSSIDCQHNIFAARSGEISGLDLRNLNNYFYIREGTRLNGILEMSIVNGHLELIDNSYIKFLSDFNIEDSVLDGLVLRNSSLGYISSGEINGSTESAIYLTRNSSIENIASTIIGINNSRYGLELEEFAFVEVAAPTVTGDLGDALVGTISHTFGAGSTTDATQLCRLKD